MPNLFNQIERPSIMRSSFNLSHQHDTAVDMGPIYPVLALEANPGDVFKISTEMLARLEPQIAPFFTEINATIHFYFVAYRNLDENFEDFITRGVDGDNSYTLPRWEVSAGKNGIGSLWDHFGNPVGVDPAGAYPIDYMRRAYNNVWNEFYRDANLQDEVDLDNEDLLYRAWEKDYFTAAFENPQRGANPPAFPITGTTSATFTIPYRSDSSTGGTFRADATGVFQSADNTTFGDGLTAQNEIDFANATTFDLEDFRYVATVQRLMERAMRTGVRYTEWLKGMYGVAPRDDRLDRPEYIGGMKSRIITSEVLQTGESGTTPQGNMAGHSITYANNRIANYRVQEFGIIIGLLSIKPRSQYHQGINRQWLRETALDFYNPLFVNLGEQEIKQAELYATDVEAENTTIFGFQGRYNELRYMPSVVTGELRPGGNLEYYTLARDFDSAPGLNEAFIKCDPGKRVFAVQTSQPSFIVNIGHRILAVRGLPIQPIPGLTRI